MNFLEKLQTLSLAKNGTKAKGFVADKNPFNLSDNEEYLSWRNNKLLKLPVSADDLLVKIEDFASPSKVEKQAIINRCNDFNMAVYDTIPNTTKALPLALARSVGLSSFDRPLCSGDDGLVEITVFEGGRKGSYIPYSDKPLSWHTDGYYNKPKEQVRGFLLHCSRDAEEGGYSEFIDPEIIYIKLRDENPEFIRALMYKDALSIPANFENGVKVRDASTGPVFSVISGELHMRYSDRKRNIEWKSDALVTDARKRLCNILRNTEKNIIRLRLQPGQGVICNNVLHRRSGFKDSTNKDKKRLLFRARYLNRVSKNICVEDN
ncbi:MAG: TauD/TfdA family dioxygenase [Pseudomonadota bacterium]|nr:TauD/TfdA family dioxygenase [Pseudomonadota bacterium]